MGGCATKPKADTSNIPEPEPTTEVPQEEANKRQSLSTLLQENEGKESTKVVEIPRETQTLEDITVSEKAADVLGQAAEQPLKIEKPVEETTKDVGEVPMEAKIEKPETVEAITETQELEEIKTETLEEKEKVMEETPVIVEPKVEKATIAVVSTETQKPEESKRETPVEEKIIEETPEAETEKPETKTTPVPETSEDKKAVEEKTFEEEKLDTTQIPETCEEKKVVAEIPVEETTNPVILEEKQTEEVK